MDAKRPRRIAAGVRAGGWSGARGGARAARPAGWCRGAGRAVPDGPRPRAVGGPDRWPVGPLPPPLGEVGRTASGYFQEASAKFSWVSGLTLGGLTLSAKAMDGGELEMGSPGRMSMIWLFSSW